MVSELKLHYLPLSLVFESEDQIAKLYLLQFLDLLETKIASDILVSLLSSQLPTGGFPSKFSPHHAGVRETCRHSILLFKCGIPYQNLNIQPQFDISNKYNVTMGDGAKIQVSPFRIPPLN